MSTIRSAMQRMASLARRHPFATLGLVLAVAAALGSGILKGSAATSCEVLATANVDRGLVQREIFATGVIKPIEGAQIKTGARLTARIEKMHVKLGDPVTKGQLIAELDARELIADRQRIEHTLAKLRSELGIVEKSYPLDKKQAEAYLKVAEADLEYATATLDRYLPLIKAHAVTLTDVDKARQEKKSAAHNLVTRKMSLEKINTEYALNVPHLKAQIAEVESELRSAEVRLSYATILSPMEGVVSEITAREGETIVAGMQVANLITILDPKSMELQIFVDENDIGLVRVGAKVAFTVPTYQNKAFSGSVDLIHPAPEIRDNIVYYRALVRLEPAVAMELRPEMTARCRILADSKDNVLRVPNAAFKWIGGTQVLFAVKDGQVLPVRVETGLAGSERTELLSGIEEGTAVATQLILPSPLPPEWLKHLEQTPGTRQASEGLGQ